MQSILLKIFRRSLNLNYSLNTIKNEELHLFLSKCWCIYEIYFLTSAAGDICWKNLKTFFVQLYNCWGPVRNTKSRALNCIFTITLKYSPTRPNPECQIITIAPNYKTFWDGKINLSILMSSTFILLGFIDLQKC